VSDETVVRAEQQLRDVIQKRDKVAARAEQLSEARKKIGFAVFADNDAKARRQLDALNVEGATLAGELEALESATSEAQRRVEVAQRRKSVAADQDKARELLKLADEFDSQVHRLAAAGDAMVAALTALDQMQAKMRSLGAQRPTGQQLDVMTARAVVSMIMAAKLNQQCGVHFLAPDERKQFADLLQYGQLLRFDANARLDQNKREAA
jgi:hypothetical protein